MDQVIQVNGPSSRRTRLERNSRKWRHRVIVAADQIFQHYSPATWGPHYRGAQGSWTVREKRTARSGWDRKNSNVKQRMRQIKVDIHLLPTWLLPKKVHRTHFCALCIAAVGGIIPAPRSHWKEAAGTAVCSAHDIWDTRPKCHFTR